MADKNKKPLGIRPKLTALILSFTALLLAVIWFLFVVFLDNFYKQAKSNEIKAAARVVESMIDGSNEDLSTEMNEISAASGASLVVVKFNDAGTETMYLSAVMQKSLLSSAPNVKSILKRLFENGGELLHVVEHETPPGVRRLDGINYQYLLYAETVKHESGPAAIIICVPLASVDTTRTTITQMLIIVSIVFVVFAFVISRVLANVLSKPLEKLNVSAKDVGTPKYKKMQGSPGCRETAELNDTLERASEEIEKVDGLRRELIANVSHDLRTPLTLISGYGEMMRDIPGENTPENIQNIIDEAEHLNRLVNDVLTLSKIENGMDKLELSEFNVTAELKALISRYSALRAAEGYTLQFDYEREYVITADEIKLMQVFYNLINNAITYTGASAHVGIIQTETEHDKKAFLRFDVTDDGDGIAPENIPYIWDRYYKENRTHKRADVGSGLGLSIVKGVMELHGGKYGVISEVGKGSDFFVEIPLERE